MYFRGKLSIDPSQLTNIEKVAPESGFKKILFKITGGQISDAQEVETFKALNIIQQIYGSLRAIGISNIIRLTHDDIDIYHDRNGERDDFSFAVDKYQLEIDDSMSTYFNSLWMVLEHEDETFKYLFEISINRNHKTGDYPIEMVVSGLLKEFQPKPGENKEHLKSRMKTHFMDQEAYNTFITTKKLAFEQFLESIRFETMKHIRVDDIKLDIHSRMVIKKEKNGAKPQPVEPTYEGMPYGYFGFGDLLLYAWLWSELSFDHNIHLSDVDLITEGGDFISSVGEAGIDAADASIMDYNEDFDIRMEDMGTMEMDTDIGSMGDVVDTESTTSWFDSIFEDGDLDIGEWFS